MTETGSLPHRKPGKVLEDLIAEAVAAERERIARYLRTVHPAGLLDRHGLRPSAGAAHVLAAAAADITHGQPAGLDGQP